MHVELLSILRCPKTGQQLQLVEPEYRGSRVYSGWLVSTDGVQRYPIRDFVPRFSPESNYADNFGMQWNRFRRTQLDSSSGKPISSNRFWTSTGWSPDVISGRWVLDAGCGAGRFAEVAVRAGANVVALDYSSAVDACYANLAQYDSMDVVQGDIYCLPFAQETFSYVYSLGVLQHTPDVPRAFAALPPMVARGGKLCVDFYGRRFGTLLHSKYLLRPVTKRLPKERLLRTLEGAVPVMLPVSRAVGSIPLVGRMLKRLVPVVNYQGVYPLTSQQIKEWALLDTFDMLAPQYDQPQTARTVRQWLQDAGLSAIEVFQAGHLVARGIKPQ
ncbi:MAG: methyltransferase domain-containing protein [Steroidobacteraceae bacterium]